MKPRSSFPLVVVAVAAVAVGTVVVVGAGCPADPAPPGEGEGGGEGEGVAGEGEGAGGEGEGAGGEGEGIGDPAPTVLSTSPAQGDLDVPTNIVTSVVWSGPIDCATVVPGTVVMQDFDSTAGIGVTVDCQNDGATFLITPADANGLPPTAHVQAAIVGSGIITSVGGTPMAADFAWDFTTAAGADTTPPQVQSKNPDDGTIDVAINSSVTIVFNENVRCSTVDATSASLSTGGNPIGSTVSCTGATVTIDPNGDLPGTTSIDGLLTTAIVDAAGNALAANVAWSFTTSAGADTTPPGPPTATTFTTPTTAATAQVSGTKDASEPTDVEFLVASASQFSLLASRDANSTWTGTVPLVVGDNVITLQSVDASGNASTTTQFTIHRDALPVADPVITQIVNAASVPTQVIEGARTDAPTVPTEILLNGTVLVPLGTQATWNALITLNAGANVLNFQARDGAGNTSNIVTESVTFTDPGAVPAGEVKVEVDIISAFTQVGDETGSFQAGGGDLNHYAVSAWVEGPFEDRSGAPESCYYDNANLQRKFTRHVKTLVRTAANGTACAGAGCAGFWGDADYRDPDFYAALVESGRWSNITNPIPATADRRNAAGHRHDPADSGQTYWFLNGANNQPRITQAPAIDGVTQASQTAGRLHFITGTPTSSCNGACGEDEHCVDNGSNPADVKLSPVRCMPLSTGTAFSTCNGSRPVPDTGGDDCGNTNPNSNVYTPSCNTSVGRCRSLNVDTCRAGEIVVDESSVGGPSAVCRGESLPDFHFFETIRWNLTDRNNARVHAGWYVVWVSINNDRSATEAVNEDIETCWDDPTQNNIGTHRAVAAVHVDGANGVTVHAVEHGRAENADACSTSNGASASSSADPGTANRVACSCPAGSVWPCPAVPNTAGGTVHFLRPNLRGSGSALSVQYCPTGACP